MTPLGAVIRKAGFELTLIRRLGRAAIYRQHEEVQGIVRRNLEPLLVFWLPMKCRGGSWRPCLNCRPARFSRSCADLLPS